MSEALKAFEEELQSKNFKGYWQNVQGDAYREPVPSFESCLGKGRTFSLRWIKPATSSDWTCRFGA